MLSFDKHATIGAQVWGSRKKSNNLLYLVPELCFVKNCLSHNIIRIFWDFVVLVIHVLCNVLYNRTDSQQHCFLVSIKVEIISQRPSMWI